MEWSKLLSGSRLCRNDEEKKDARSEFQRDYDVVRGHIVSIREQHLYLILMAQKK